MSRSSAVSLMMLGILIAVFGVFYAGLSLFEDVPFEAWWLAVAWLALVGGIALLGFGIYSSPPLTGGASARQLPIWYEWVSFLLAFGLPIGAGALLVWGRDVSLKTIAWRICVVLIVSSILIRPVKQIVPAEKAAAFADAVFWAAMGALLVLIASPFASS